MLKPYEVIINTADRKRTVVVRARHPEEAFEQAILLMAVPHEDVILGRVRELEAEGGPYVN